MKHPPVDNDDVPLAFQFDDVADDTDDPTSINNNDDILSIMSPADDDEENVTHGPANTSQYFNIVDPSLQPTSQSLKPYNSIASLPPNYQFQIDLQDILSNHRTDLKLQDEIVGLLQNYSHDEKLTFSTATLSSRASFMTKLERTMNTSSLKHDDVIVNLTSGTAATVSVFNLEAMIMSMLSDDQIMNPKNIAQGYNLFTGKSVEGQGQDDVYGEIHTGDIWDETVDRFCGNHPQNMPLGLVIFGDKSHLDLKGALSTIPIIFTFTCFNEDARNKVENWRPLSFLPNLCHGGLSSKNKKDPVLSVQDEHDCLRVAFSSLVDIYLRGGIKATVMGRDVIVKPWIHFFVGDTSGNNRWLGHFNGSGNITRPYRDCECTYKDMDDPTPSCTYIKRAQYHDQQLMRSLAHTKKAKKDIDSLFSKQPIENAFMNPNLPLSDLLHGCYRMFPPEVLHTLDEGTSMYMIESLKLTIGDIGAGKALKNDIEHLHHTIHHEIKRNSERDFPRGSSRNGVLANTLVTATERRGNMFRLLCVCHTDQVRSHLRHTLLEKQIRLSEFIDCLKLYLGYGEWLHSTNLKHEVKSSRPLIADMIRLIHKVFPRTDVDGEVIGQGWKIPKMHAVPKFVDYIIDFGCAINFFGGIGECNHKTFVKDTGCNTQKRINSFTSQVASRYYESMILEVANKHKNNRISTQFEYVGTSCERNRGATMEGKYILTISELSVNGVFSSFSTKKHTNLPTKFVQAVSLHAGKFYHSPTYTVVGYTACKMPIQGRQEIFRAVASFGDKGQKWYDWCLVNWTEDEVVRTYPAKILGFVNMDHTGLESDSMDSIHVVIQSSKDVVSMETLTREFVSKFTMPSNDNIDNSTYLVSIASIEHPLCVFKNYGGLCTQFFCALPKRRWGRYFGDRIEIINNETDCLSSELDYGSDEDDDYNDDADVENDDDDDVDDE